MVLRRATRKRGEGADFALQHLGAVRPVQPGLVLGNLVGVGDAVQGLGRLRQGGGLRLREGLHNHLGPQRGQFVVQTGRGVIGGDGQALDQAHGAGIQARIHLHDGHAGVGIARFNGPVDGRGTAPARQQAGVDVQAAQPGQIQHPLRQQQAIGGHHQHIKLGGLQGGLARLGLIRILTIQAQTARLGHGDAVGEGGVLHGRGLQLQAAPGRAIGLGEHQGHGKTGRHNAL